LREDLLLLLSEANARANIARVDRNAVGLQLTVGSTWMHFEGNVASIFRRSNARVSARAYATRRGSELVPSRVSLLCPALFFSNSPSANPSASLESPRYHAGARETISRQRKRERGKDAPRPIDAHESNPIPVAFPHSVSSTCIKVHVEKTTQGAVRTPSSHRVVVFHRNLEQFRDNHHAALDPWRVCSRRVVSSNARNDAGAASYLDARILEILFRGDLRGFPSRSPSGSTFARARNVWEN